MEKILKIDEIKPNPNNPRTIRDDKFKKLVKSLQDFPEMLKVRPIVIDDLGFILGGNMRWRAAKEAGFEEMPVIVVDWNEKQKKEFLIKDNINYGDWDYLLLKDFDALEEWGMDIPEWLNFDDEDEEDFFDELLKDFENKKNTRSEEYVETFTPNTSSITYFLLNLEKEDFEWIKKFENQIIKKTGCDNISDAAYKIIIEK